MTSLSRILLRLPGVYQALAFLTARRAVVRGPTMSPTLAPGEYVLFDRLAYRRGAPRRGDVVLASHPQRPGTRIIKRVAGAPGETVVVGGRTWTLGEGEWLLLGAGARFSTDRGGVRPCLRPAGRGWGPVGRESIQARAWIVYWPPGKVRRVRRGPRV